MLWCDVANMSSSFIDFETQINAYVPCGVSFAGIKCNQQRVAQIPGIVVMNLWILNAFLVFIKMRNGNKRAVRWGGGGGGRIHDT